MWRNLSIVFLSDGLRCTAGSIHEGSSILRTTESYRNQSYQVRWRENHPTHYAIPVDTQPVEVDTRLKWIDTSGLWIVDCGYSIQTGPNRRLVDRTHPIHPWQRFSLLFRS